MRHLATIALLLYITLTSDERARLQGAAAAAQKAANKSGEEAAATYEAYAATRKAIISAHPECANITCFLDEDLTRLVIP